MIGICEAKQRVHNVASIILNEYGIAGDFTVQYIEDAGYIPSICIQSISFHNPKDQFVYDLRGGDNYFMPKVYRLYTDRRDAGTHE